MTRFHILRRTIQILVALVFLFLPWLGITQIAGSLFALQIGPIPFADPVATLSVVATGTLPNVRLLAGAGITLLIAFFLGRVFCGWICPYGLFSEWIHAFHTRKRPLSFAHALFTKCVILVVCVQLFALCALPILGLCSYPGALSLIPIAIWEEAGAAIFLSLGLAPFLTLCAEAISGERLWCRFVCPQSVLLGLSAWLLPKQSPGLRIRWQAKQCTCKENPACVAACSLRLSPRHSTGPNRLHCIQCGECVLACAKHGKALSWSLTPSTKAKKTCP
ncbi:MAG: 4Fe-4S binding protein [Desulfovibrio sp.]|nr:4Fe-4S binding protein [Desulfovibrio sp.]